MPSAHRVTVSIEDDLHMALAGQAEDDQRTIPDVIREAIHFYLADVYGEGIGTTAEDAIKDGRTNAEALAIVREKFPRANTTLSGIAFYRSRLRRTEKRRILTNAEAERAGAGAARPRKKK